MASMISVRAFASLTVGIILTTLVSTGNGDSQSDTLLALKGKLIDPAGTVFSSWDASANGPCQWTYINCDANGNVIQINLQNNNLGGTLSTLDGLPNLQNLELFGNNIEGSIPTEFGNLNNLISLDLYRNKLSGPIPSSLGKLKSVKFLRLNDNKLNGNIPTEIGDMSSLSVLDLSNNNLCGTIPPAVAGISGANFANNPGLGRPC